MPKINPKDIQYVNFDEPNPLQFSQQQPVLQQTKYSNSSSSKVGKPPLPQHENTNSRDDTLDFLNNLDKP